MTGEPRVRIARWNAVCGAPGCLHLINEGAPITQPAPGRAWQHLNCAQPGRRARERHDAEHATSAARRR